MSISDVENSFSQKLRAWRRLNGLKQLALADMLGVSQAAVSYWETGRDRPSPDLMKRISDLISRTSLDEVALERAFTLRQHSVMALFDLDGVRFLAASRGYRALWPAMAQLEGQTMETHLVNEAGALLANPATRRDITAGRLALISGVSDRHTDYDLDFPVHHEWNICFRRFGHMTLMSITYTPCCETIRPGIVEIMHFDDLH